MLLGTQGQTERPRVILCELPTFPSGVLALSLPTVAAQLRDHADVQMVDLNVVDRSRLQERLLARPAPRLCGFRVTAQNFGEAAELTALARRLSPSTAIIWGGELPSLLPHLCLQHADSIMEGRFEPHAAAVLHDLEQGSLNRRYERTAWSPSSETVPPALDMVEHRERYLGFPGTPLESSLGCDQNCTFCLVHTMQHRIAPYPPEALARDLSQNPREFINVVDYNPATSREHLLKLAKEIERSPAIGWSCEMRLEVFEDDEVLDALGRSRCRVVYCGLESLSSDAMHSVAKKHQGPTQRLRLIRRAQSRGIQIGSGFILGMQGETDASRRAFVDFAEEAGLVYVKFTFLTYNPGTRVHESLRKRGDFTTEELSRFDGHHLTYLPQGTDPVDVYRGARAMIERLYSPRSVRLRSRHQAREPLERAEFALLSYCYGRPYQEWLRANPAKGAPQPLHKGGARFDWKLKSADRALVALRRLNATRRAR